MRRPPRRSLAGTLNKLLHLPRWFRRHASYKDVWTWIGLSEAAAFCMMDYSHTEEELRARGGRTAEALRAALLIEPTHRVLEVGCGVARVGRELAPHCGEWHGADISPTILRRAARRLAHLSTVRLHRLESSNLSLFPDDSFDRLYCVAVLVHLDKEDLYKYLREFRRVLKPRGLAYYDTHNLADERAWGHWERAALAAPADRRKQPHRERLATQEEMEIYTRRTGLVPLAAQANTFLVQVIAGKPGAGEGPEDSWAGELRARIAPHLPGLEPGRARLKPPGTA